MPVINQKKFIAGVTTGHVAVSSGPTDVCKTPSPAGPVPLPYPNAAPTALPGPGYSTKVLISGAPAFTTRSKTALSNGDQPGALGGVKSSVIMGPTAAIMGSCDVSFEGAAVVRTRDATDANRANGAMGTMVHAGAALPPSGPGSTLCHAFDAALHDWCSDGKGHRSGSFNDYVFRRLKAVDPKQWEALRREVPIGVLTKSEVPLPKGFAKLVAEGGRLGQGGEEIVRRLRTGNFAAARALPQHGNFNLFRWKLAGEIHQLFRKAGAPVQRVLFPDATRPDGTPIEIKKPAEQESHPGQKANYAKCSPNGKCESLDCASCGLPCKSWRSECRP
jgi:hypothetical protein